MSELRFQNLHWRHAGPALRERNGPDTHRKGADEQWLMTNGRNQPGDGLEEGACVTVELWVAVLHVEQGKGGHVLTNEAVDSECRAR